MAGTVRNVLLLLILLFPLIFFLGLLPQPLTFLHFLAEEVNVYIFGGGGTISMQAAFLEVIKGGIGWTILVAVGIRAYDARFAPGVALDSQIPYIGLGLVFG